MKFKKKRKRKKKKASKSNPESKTLPQVLSSISQHPPLLNFPSNVTSYIYQGLNGAFIHAGFIMYLTFAFLLTLLFQSFSVIFALAPALQASFSFPLPGITPCFLFYWDQSLLLFPPELLTWIFCSCGFSFVHLFLLCFPPILCFSAVSLFGKASRLC